MGWADNCRDGGTYIGKDGKRHSYDRLIVNPPDKDTVSGGGGFCLLNLSLMLAAPVAVVALIAKRTRARVHTGGAA